MKKLLIKTFLLILLILILTLIDLNTGASNLNILTIIKNLFNGSISETQKLILFQLRLPRILTAFLAAIALPVSGLLLQTLLYNPLAGPYVLGINTGAALGMAFATLTASLINIILPKFYSVLSSISGALLVLMLIIYLTNKFKNSVIVLLFGIFINSIISAFIDLMIFFSKNTDLKIFMVWTLGSFDNAELELVAILLPISIFLTLSIAFDAKKIDSIYLGEETALTLGVNINRLKIKTFAITGILSGLVTAIAGPISFVGVAVPHLARIFFKTPHHFWLINGSILIGIVMVLISDIISHSFGNYILPINTINSLWGLPVIMYILLKNKSFN